MSKSEYRRLSAMGASPEEMAQSVRENACRQCREEERARIVDKLRTLLEESRTEAARASGKGGTYSGGLKDFGQNLAVLIAELSPDSREDGS